MSIKVFDIKGGEIKELIKGLHSAGKHSITFDASDLASGVYFYQITASGFVESRKMLLLK